jgi:CheY-like chemotaxis protein
MRAKASSATTFFDFEQSDTNEDQIAYFTTPVYNAASELTAIIALEFKPQLITDLVAAEIDTDKAGESYLVGIDRFTEQFELRSELKTEGNEAYVVGHPLQKNIDYCLDAQELGYQGGHNTYTDSTGNQELISFRQVKVPGHDWYLISKISKDVVTQPINQLETVILAAVSVLILLIGFIAWRFARSFTEPLLASMNFAQDIARGKLDAKLVWKRKDEMGELCTTLHEMAVQLREEDWMQKGKESLDNELRGDLGLTEQSERFISFFTRHMDAQLGAFYLYDEKEKLLNLVSSHAFTDRRGNFNQIRLGEGMIGQAALEKSVIAYADVIENAPVLNYGAGEVSPRYFMAVPLLTDTHLIGVALIGSLSPFSERQLKYVDQAMGIAAVNIDAAKAQDVIEALLNKAQQQEEILSKANKDLEEQTEALQTSEKALQIQQEELRVTNEELEEQTKVLLKSEAELQAQQEELRVANEELEEQTKGLIKSEAELQAQQEELRVTNEELEERTKALEDQKIVMQEKNDELHMARQIVEEKALELEVASKYKSEFLANMSHELRTPLNSILILSELFANNKNGNLTAKQIESARAINSSGSDLLSLINQILDLSKVEAGKIDLIIEQVSFDSIEKDLNRLYRDITAEKGLTFEVNIAQNLPKTIESDSQRLQQVLRNLLTNAVKFTHKGTVSLSVEPPSPEMAARMNQPCESLVAFHVKDDGIGIKEEQQVAIFQAFQQADGSTSRNYGGTGLGLSISKELTHLLGGSILLQSAEGSGSTFTVLLPLKYTAKEHEGTASPVPSPQLQKTPVDRAATAPGKTQKTLSENRPQETPQEKQTSPAPIPAQDTSYVVDDRQNLVPGDKTLLIVEDDRAFAGIMRDFAHERGFKCIVAETGETGLHFADFYKPSAIILDIGLPGIDGWTVMERLKKNPELRPIPVHFMSASDANLDAMRMGAIGYLTKPVDVSKLDQAFGRIEDIISKPVKKLLVVEDDEIQRESIRQLIGEDDVQIKAVSNGREALEELESQRYDCMVLDLGLEDMSGLDLLETIRRSETAARVPIIVYTGRDLTQKEEEKLKRYAESIIVKGVKSPERLLDETALFLHRVESQIPSGQQGKLKAVHDKEKVLNGKNILLVDDDMRNVFALSSMLEEKGTNIIIARNGQESLDKLQEHPETDLVLMDIMMPVMDGYEAIQKIREQKKYRSLPIIALTAKAMKGDRSKCIEAGASDYLAKPIDINKLASMMRVWLY